MPISYSEELNASQLAAVQCCDAPSLVIAGAGSGKTRVLTYKIAYLIEQGYKPWNILALTFTNKAAREMRERIGRLVGEEQAQPLWMGTFHSVFARILRAEAQYIGFDPNFTIYDAQDSQSLIKMIIKDMGLDTDKYKPNKVASRISAAKNALITPDRYANDFQLRNQDDACNLPALHSVYTRYAQRLRQSNAMDFDDLLLHTFLLLRDDETIRKKYEERFQYILVDEFQDTNLAQDRIVWLLARNHQRLCAVGDDAQSIYSFRGAKIDNILNFQQTYSGTRLFKLEQNYRSTQCIVGAANSIIAHNRRQIRKDVYSRKEEGQPIKVCEAYGEQEEAAIVAREIDALHRHAGYEWNEIAILYRTNSQSRTFEEELRRRNFPYRIYGGLSFYQRKEIKDTIAYLRLTLNLHDEESLRRIINYPARGIGNTTLQHVFQCAMEHQVSPWEVVARPDDFALAVNQGTKSKLRAFAQLILSFHQLVGELDAHQLAIRIIRESGLYDTLHLSHDPEDVSRQENLQELADSISLFVRDAQEQGRDTSLAQYLQEVSLISDLDSRDEEAEDAPRITLMTVHSAKGLEFRAVFVVGLEENLFPSEMALDMPSQIEEERRLMYVAMTRAQERLFLTWSHSRVRFGKFQNNEKSRFLREIDKQYLGTPAASSRSLCSAARAAAPAPRPASMSRSESTSASMSKSASESMSKSASPSNIRRVSQVTSPFTAQAPAPSQANGLAVGARIMHERFGEGQVKKMEGKGMDLRVTVEFANVGTKVLLVRFAKFTIL